MARAKVMENGINLDTLDAKLGYKGGMPMFFIKQYKNQSNIMKAFYQDQAYYSYNKGKRIQEFFVDSLTLNQISPKEALIDKRPPENLRTLNEQATDILHAHKESAKRVGQDAQNIAVIITWAAIIIISIALFLTVYFVLTKTITVDVHYENPISTAVTTIISAKGG